MGSGLGVEGRPVFAALRRGMGRRAVLLVFEFGLLEFKALALDLGALAGLFEAAVADEVAHGFAKTLQLVAELPGHLALRLFKDGGVAGDQGRFYVIGNAGSQADKFLAVSLKILHIAQPLAVGLPVKKAALLPLGEVDLVDGVSFEISFKDFFDFGEGVEPGDESDAGFAIIEAAVEFFAEVAGEAGDFTVESHKKQLMS